MKRFIVFSQPLERNFDELLTALFPTDLSPKILAYMPANGVASGQKYIEFWKKITNEHGAKFRLIDNEQNLEAERVKLLGSTILLITGGNTFGLLQNLRSSGLFSTIQEFSQKKDFVLAGFSAGALVLTPTIEICTLDGFDDNQVGISNLDALNLIPFEVFPHYDETREVDLTAYRSKTKYEVRTIKNDEHIVIDL